MAPLQMELGGKDARITCRWGARNVSLFYGVAGCQEMGWEGVVVPQQVDLGGRGCLHNLQAGGVLGQLPSSIISSYWPPLAPALILCAVPYFACRSDADIDLAAKAVIKGGFSYSGQRCTAVKAVLVLQDVADALVEKVRGRKKRPQGWVCMCACVRSARVLMLLCSACMPGQRYMTVPSAQLAVLSAG